MVFRGLFVGIDRYASTQISWLDCARRDARAMHALFADTLGTGAIQLLDREATRIAIEQHFAALAACDEDDVVVVYFSGHGSDTHELITYDADILHLPETAIPLDTLAEWFARIPARRLVCILDCCFSGGMGAKVLHAPVRPRTLASTDTLLDRLSGTGRLIFTAAAATQEAWEDTRVGHGFLTHYLLQALQGAEEVVEAGKIDVYRLLSYVTRRVGDAAAQIGRRQTPTLRGQIDGELTWPVFAPGPRYKAACPEYGGAEVTREIASLSAYGFPQELLDAWAGAIPSLNALQRDAINDYGLLRGEHLVVSAPTSSGKTMIGELAALRGTLERRRALFLLPLKALVNDKHAEFARTYGAYGLVTIRATGEVSDDIPALMRGQYDLCLMTYEKFAALALGSPHILAQVGTIVVDEVQMIADPSRGANLEFILTLLRTRRGEGIEPHLICLSAVIGDTNGLERWLGARLLRRTERPVPLDEGVLRGDGSFRYLDPEDGRERIVARYIQPVWSGKQSNQDYVIPLVRRLVDEGKQVIVFRNVKSVARSTALYLARDLGLSPAHEALEALPAGDPSNASAALRTALEGGVAFHTADLDREERLAIEAQFRAPGTTLRVIAATTTLAMGVNTPASAVVVVELDHPGPDGPTPYAVAEYKNMVGRAGRLGYQEHGDSYLIAPAPHQEHHVWARYVRGTPEDVVSHFLAGETDPRSLIVGVLAAVPPSAPQGMAAEEIVAFLEGSFGAYQERLREERWRWDRETLDRALVELVQHRLIARGDAGDYWLTALGRLAGEGRVEVGSILSLVGALSDVPPESLTDPTLIAAAQLTTELDDVYFPFNRSSKYQEPATWRGELQRQGVAPGVLAALGAFGPDRHDGTVRAKKAAACLLWITDWPLAQIEQALMRHQRESDGAGAIRAVSERTVDLLPTVARVAELVHEGLDLAERQVRLIARLEAGVPAIAADLARQLGKRLTRGDYRRLLTADLCAIAAIEGAEDAALLACLNDNLGKLTLVREAVIAYREREKEQSLPSPVLPPYEG